MDLLSLAVTFFININLQILINLSETIDLHSLWEDYIKLSSPLNYFYIKATIKVYSLINPSFI